MERRTNFEEAWSRYLPEDGTSAKGGGMEPPHRHNPQETVYFWRQTVPPQQRTMWRNEIAGNRPVLRLVAVWRMKSPLPWRRTQSTGPMAPWGNCRPGRVTAAAAGVTGGCLSLSGGPGPVDLLPMPATRPGGLGGQSRCPGGADKTGNRAAAPTCPDTAASPLADAAVRHGRPSRHRPGTDGAAVAALRLRAQMQN